MVEQTFLTHLLISVPLDRMNVKCRSKNYPNSLICNILYTYIRKRIFKLTVYKQVYTDFIDTLIESTRIRIVNAFGKIAARKKGETLNPRQDWTASCWETNGWERYLYQKKTATLNHVYFITVKN
jgi:hypothetical protein